MLINTSTLPIGKLTEFIDGASELSLSDISYFVKNMFGLLFNWWFYVPFAFVVFDILIAVYMYVFNNGYQKDIGDRYTFSLVIGVMTDVFNILADHNMVIENKVKMLASFQWYSCLGKLIFFDIKTSNIFVSIFVLVEILVCVFHLHNFLHSMISKTHLFGFVNIDSKKAEIVSESLIVGIFNNQILSRTVDLLPLNQLSSLLDDAYYAANEYNLILATLFFISVHLSAHFVGRIVNVFRREVNLPLVFAIFQPLAFLCAAIGSYFLLDFLGSSTNPKFRNDQYEDKIIKYTGSIVAQIGSFNDQTKRKCVDYLQYYQSWRDIADKNKIEEAESRGRAKDVVDIKERFEGRRKVFGNVDISIRFFFILACLILGCFLSLCVRNYIWRTVIEIGEGKRVEDIANSTINRYDYILAVCIFLCICIIFAFNYGDMLDMFYCLQHIAHNNLHYLIDAKYDDPYSFMESVQIGININENRVLYQCIPIVESSDDRMFQVRVKASDFNGFKDRYPDSDGNFFLRPIPLKSMLIEYLREGNTEKVINVLNVLSGLTNASDELKALCGDIKNRVFNSRVLLKDVHFLMDQKNGMFASLLSDIIVGCDVPDYGFLLGHIMNEHSVKEILSKWNDMYSRGESVSDKDKKFPKFEVPAKYLNDNLVAQRLYGKDFQALGSETQLICKERYKQLLSGPKKKVIYIVRAPFVTPISYKSISGELFNANAALANNDKLNVEYVKESKVARGLNFLVKGQNGAGKSNTLGALVGKIDSTFVTVVRLTAAQARLSALFRRGLKTYEEFVEGFGDLAVIPLCRVNKDQRNYYLHGNGSSDSVGVPGATFGEAMEAGLSTNLDYVSTCLKLVIKLIKNSKNIASDKDIGSVICALSSAHSVLCYKDKDGNDSRDAQIAKNIDDVIVGISSDILKNSKNISLKQYLPNLAKTLEIVNVNNKQLTSWIQRDAYELRTGMAAKINFTMPNADTSLWYFSTGENAKASLINTCVNLVIRGLNPLGKAQDICLNDEGFANVDRESTAVISSWFKRPLVSLGITNIEIAHHSDEFDINSPDVLMYFDAKLQTIVFYYRKNGRWWSEVEFIRVGFSDFEIFYLDNGAELIVAKVPDDFKLNQNSLNALLDKWSKERPEFRSMKDLSEADLFIRNIIGLDPEVIAREFNFRPMGFRSEVLNSFYNPEELWYLLSVLGYDYKVDRETRTLVDDEILAPLDDRSRRMLEEYLVELDDPSSFRSIDDEMFLNEDDNDSYSSDEDSDKDVSTTEDEDVLTDDEDYEDDE